MLITLLVFAQVSNSLRSVFLSQWGASEDGANSTKEWSIFQDFGQFDFIGVYTGFQFLSLVILLFISFYSKSLQIKASRSLHENMLHTVFRAPMSFFHANPLGRITNRFSKDISDVDKDTMPNIQKFLQSIFQLVGSLIVMCTTTVYTTAVVVPVFFSLAFVVRFFQRSNLEVKRLDSLSRGPIFSQYSECVNGLENIRAYRNERHELEKSAKAVDTHIALDLCQQSLDQWLNIVLVLLGSCLVLACCVFGVASVNLLGSAVSLMVIQVSTELSPVFASLLTNYAVAEQGLNAVERVDEYSNLESEKFESKEKPNIPEGWPRSGRIEFQKVVARYRADLAPILNGLTVTIEDGEKVRAHVRMHTHAHIYAPKYGHSRVQI